MNGILSVGSQIAGYRIEGVLGHGGMGVVYEARQLSLNRLVALKVLAPQLGLDSSFRERFRKEGHIQAAIDHPHIVTVYEAGEIDEGLFLVMRLIRGATLKDLIVARELEGARTLRILTPIADALDAAHEAGLIHRDIKPQNILVGHRDHAYLADFGLTKGTDEQGLTKTGQFVGTVDYSAPEQIRGEQATACTDVYSLTAVLYECLTGVVPYPKPSDAAVMFAHMSDPAPKITDQRPDLPAALDEVVARGMAKRPNDRHASASELMEDATRAFGRRVRAVITPPGPVERPEETGIREVEAEVPTRPTRLRSPSEAAREAEALARDAAAADPTLQRTAEPEKADATVVRPVEPETAPADQSAERAAGSTGDATVVPPADSEGEGTAQRYAEATVVRAAEPEPAAPSGERHRSNGEAPAPAGSRASSIAPIDRATTPARAETTFPAPAETASPAPAATTRPSARPSDDARPLPRAVRADVPAAKPPPRQAIDPRSLARTSRPAFPFAVARFWPVAAVVLVCAVAAVAGYLLGQPEEEPAARSPAAPAALSATATGGGVALRHPADWSPRSASQEIPGLALEDALTVAPSEDASAGVVMGRAQSDHPSLLPAGLRTRLGETPPEGDQVRLGSLEAIRYRDLELEGFDGRLTVYAVPTTAGVATVACFNAAAGAEAAAQCDRIAATTRLVGASAYALGPQPGYAKGLGRVLARLNRARTSGRSRLAAAERPRRQAAHAAGLATAYRRAARRVGDFEVTPAATSANAGIAAALASTAAAYDRLGRAARDNQRSRYEAASADVRRGEARIERSLAALEPLGYRVR